MKVSITSEQRKALEMAGDRPLEIVDPETNTIYVLIPADQFDRLRTASEAVRVRDMYPAVDRTFGRAGWDGPEMDAYNDL